MVSHLDRVPNELTAPSPAIKSRLQIEGHRRGVGDPDC